MKNPTYLHPLLANHRRGRLLSRLLDASALDASNFDESLPDAGIILVIGQDFQSMKEQGQTRLQAWCQLPGRTLLLLPPFREGPISPSKDWYLNYREPPKVREPSTLSGILSEEVTLSLLGHDGTFDQIPDYQWSDGSPNCRYMKKHSGAGVFAATTLPLWSISLMGKKQELQSWLTKLYNHSGAAPATDKLSEKGVTLEPVDYTTMVCIYGWQCANKSELYRKVSGEDGIGLFSIEPSTLEESLTRLNRMGYIQDPTNKAPALALSAQGIKALTTSPYWGYAEQLRLSCKENDLQGPIQQPIQSQRENNGEND